MERECMYVYIYICIYIYVYMRCLFADMESLFDVVIHSCCFNNMVWPVSGYGTVMFFCVFSRF